MAIAESDVVRYLTNLRLFELKPLIQTLERELGVTAQPVTHTTNPPRPDLDLVEILYDVVMVDIGPKRLEVIRVLRERLGLDLRSARDLADRAPGVMRERLEEGEAKRLCAALIEAGARAELRAIRS